MEWVVAFDLPLPPERAFEAARHFHHAYPRMHPAHRPPTGPVGLLAPGYRQAGMAALRDPDGSVWVVELFASP